MSRGAGRPTTTPLPAHIRREVKAELARRGRSQKQLAAQLDLHPVYLNQMLSGTYGGITTTWLTVLDAVGLQLVAVPKEEPRER